MFFFAIEIFHMERQGKMKANGQTKQKSIILSRPIQGTSRALNSTS